MAFRSRPQVALPRPAAGPDREIRCRSIFASTPEGDFPEKTANSSPVAYLCLTLKAAVIIVGLAHIGAGENSWFGHT